jgi:hypothetical protein
MVGLKRGRRSGGGECAKCSRQYEGLLDHIRKKHMGARFAEGEVDGTGLVACACGALIQCSWAGASPEANDVCGLGGDKKDQRHGAKHIKGQYEIPDRLVGMAWRMAWLV